MPRVINPICKPKELNKRQLAYCYHRARNNTIEKSMNMAGYTCVGLAATSTGSRLESNANIKERIEHEIANIFDKNIITNEYILENLNSIAINGENESNRLRAIELLGKHLAMFTDNINNKETPPPILYDNLFDSNDKTAKPSRLPLN